MSSLESMLAAGQEAPLLSALDFTLPPSTTAVVDRRQRIKAYPTSASSLSPTGTKTVRIRLGGDDWCATESVRIQYTITNKDAANPLMPLCGPWGAWVQCFLRSSGCELDNLPFFGRHFEMFGWRLLDFNSQWGEAAIAGLGGSWGAGATMVPRMGTIAAGASYTVMHRLPLSVFNSNRYWPTRYAPLELELSLGAPSDWLTTTGNNSSTYEISNIQLVYDAMVLDESVSSSYFASLLSNAVLSVPTLTVFQYQQSIPAGSTSFSFSSVRAFSRVVSLFLTFKNDGPMSSSHQPAHFHEQLRGRSGVVGPVA